MSDRRVTDDDDGHSSSKYTLDWSQILDSPVVPPFLLRGTSIIFQFSANYTHQHLSLLCLFHHPEPISAAHSHNPLFSPFPFLPPWAQSAAHPLKAQTTARLQKQVSITFLRLSVLCPTAPRRRPSSLSILTMKVMWFLLGLHASMVELQLCFARKCHHYCQSLVVKEVGQEEEPRVRRLLLSLLGSQLTALKQ